MLENILLEGAYPLRGEQGLALFKRALQQLKGVVQLLVVPVEAHRAHMGQSGKHSHGAG